MLRICVPTVPHGVGDPRGIVVPIIGQIDGAGRSIYRNAASPLGTWSRQPLSRSP